MIQGASLFVVLLAARLLTIIGHEAGFVSGASPILHGVLEDALIASSVAFLDVTIGRPRFTWIVYAGLALVAALDVPVARALGTPVTPVMLRGARVALADSILTHATPDAVLRVLGVMATSVAAPLVLLRARVSRARARVRAGERDGAPVDARGHVWAAVGTLAAVVAATAVAPGGTTPFHRNAVMALVPSWSEATPPSLLSRASAGVLDGELTGLRGVARGRNVLLIVLESTGAAPLGLYGAPGTDPMPRLSRIAASSLVFEAAYSTFPESIRSQVAYWDSRHPGVGQMPEDLATPPVSPLPTVLRDLGYRTALVHSGHFDYLGMEHVVRGRGFDHLADAGEIDSVRATSFGVDEESAVAHLLDWIDAGDSAQPFFAAYLPIAGHHPYDTPRPGPFPTTTAQSQYLNALHYADEALALALDGLERRGILEETLVVVTGDHGEAFGEHPGNHGHTFQLYEENVWVPLVISLPRADTSRFDAARRVERVASHVDLAPTILSLLGASPPDGWEGASLLDDEPRVALFGTDWADRLVGLRDGRWKFIHSLDTGDSQLFDLQSDPQERRNLADARPALVARYRACLLPTR